MCDYFKEHRAYRSYHHDITTVTVNYCTPIYYCFHSRRYKHIPPDAQPTGLPSWIGLCTASAKRFLRASAMLKHVIAIGLTSVRHTLAPYQNG